MSKAKTASKNNPTSRQQSKEFFYDSKKVKPVKLVTQKSSFFAAEFEDSGELVIDASGSPLSWEKVRASN